MTIANDIPEIRVLDEMDSHPGLIATVLLHKGQQTASDLAASMNIPETSVADFLIAKTDVDDRLAAALERGTDVPASQWMLWQTKYNDTEHNGRLIRADIEHRDAPNLWRSVGRYSPKKIADELAKHVKRRWRKGMEKYGTRFSGNPPGQALEEVLDALLYLIYVEGYINELLEERKQTKQLLEIVSSDNKALTLDAVRELARIRTG